MYILSIFSFIVLQIIAALVPSPLTTAASPRALAPSMLNVVPHQMLMVDTLPVSTLAPQSGDAMGLVSTLPDAPATLLPLLPPLLVAALVACAGCTAMVGTASCLFGMVSGIISNERRCLQRGLVLCGLVVGILAALANAAAELPLDNNNNYNSSFVLARSGLVDALVTLRALDAPRTSAVDRLREQERRLLRRLRRFAFGSRSAFFARQILAELNASGSAMRLLMLRGVVLAVTNGATASGSFRVLLARAAAQLPQLIVTLCDYLDVHAQLCSVPGPAPPAPFDSWSSTSPPDYDVSKPATAAPAGAHASSPDHDTNTTPPAAGGEDAANALATSTIPPPPPPHPPPSPLEPRNNDDNADASHATQPSHPEVRGRGRSRRSTEARRRRRNIRQRADIDRARSLAEIQAALVRAGVEENPGPTLTDGGALEGLLDAAEARHERMLYGHDDFAPLLYDPRRRPPRRVPLRDGDHDDRAVDEHAADIERELLVLVRVHDATLARARRCIETGAPADDLLLRCTRLARRAWLYRRELAALLGRDSPPRPAALAVAAAPASAAAASSSSTPAPPPPPLAPHSLVTVAGVWGYEVRVAIVPTREAARFTLRHVRANDQVQRLRLLAAGLRRARDGSDEDSPTRRFHGPPPPGQPDLLARLRSAIQPRQRTQTLAEIRVLLQRGGVEENPGPVHATHPQAALQGFFSHVLGDGEPQQLRDARAAAAAASATTATTRTASAPPANRTANAATRQPRVASSSAAPRAGGGASSGAPPRPPPPAPPPLPQQHTPADARRGEDFDFWHWYLDAQYSRITNSAYVCVEEVLTHVPQPHDGVEASARPAAHRRRVFIKIYGRSLTQKSTLMAVLEAERARTGNTRLRNAPTI
jgi:hypothetical protein